MAQRTTLSFSDSEFIEREVIVGNLVFKVLNNGKQTKETNREFQRMRRHFENMATLVRVSNKWLEGC